MFSSCHEASFVLISYSRRSSMNRDSFYEAFLSFTAEEDREKKLASLFCYHPRILQHIPHFSLFRSLEMTISYYLVFLVSLDSGSWVSRKMSHPICRSSLMRNLSSSPPTNYSMIVYYMTWITNGLSLLIFTIALLGNLAALMVMLTPRHTLRITNQTYLINLAFADLLRTCCIPFTIIPRMKRSFIFGESMCRLLPVLQGK